MKINCAHDELVELHKLVPNPKNANRHSIEQIKRLAKIIDYQGMRSPIVVSNQSGFITKGHGRLEALQLLGWEKAPVNFQDYESEAQEYSDIIADNEIARWAELDWQSLHDDLEEFKTDIDIDMLGIESFNLPEVETPDPQTDEDSVPEIPDEPVTKRGDVWLLGNHRVMCGDSTMIDDVEKLMNGEKADMVFTDPPYGVKYRSNVGKNFDMLKNDDQFLDFLPCLEAFTKKDTPWFIWTSHRVYPKWREMYSQYYTSTVIWHKGGGGLGDLKGDYLMDYEMALYCKKGKPQFLHQRPMAVWRISKDGGASYIHPTQKPVELSEYAMGNFLKASTLIMDLFLGSGSTLIGCEKTNRKCFGMELDEKYCDVIIKRWQEYTGRQAILEGADKTYADLENEKL